MPSTPNAEVVHVTILRNPLLAWIGRIAETGAGGRNSIRNSEPLNPEALTQKNPTKAPAQQQLQAPVQGGK